MVYVRWPVLKTGLFPNAKTHMNPQNLTPSQKMLLTRNRIWGNMIGANGRSGYKELKKKWSADTQQDYGEFAFLK